MRLLWSASDFFVSRTDCRMTQIDRYLLIIYFRVLAICFLLNHRPDRDHSVVQQLD